MPNAAQGEADHAFRPSWGPNPALCVIDRGGPGIVSGQARAFGSERMNGEDMTMRRVNYAGVLLVLAQGLVWGCSSAETPNDPPATGGTGGSTGGTGGASGGTGGSTGGSGGTTGGTSGTGGGAGASTDPACKGISSNAMCTNVGLSCPGLVCGLGDSGARTCDCTGTWACTACNWDNTTFPWAMSKPADITPCLGTEQDKIACTTLDATCENGGNGGTEACVCFLDDEDNQIWDCDRPPGTWAAAAN